MLLQLPQRIPYRFTDFFRMGAPLQVLLAFVSCGGILWLWGV